MNAELTVGTLASCELAANPNEVAARLGTGRDYSCEAVERCRERLWEALSCKYAGFFTEVTYLPDNSLDLGFARFRSESLARNLKGARRALVFAVTTGIGVDRLLLRLSRVSQAEHFITDALSSAAAEAACDAAQRRLQGDLIGRPRFSPGYGDLPLGIQPALLGALRADRTLGITLNDALLMTPMKSITAIMGICDES